MDERKKDTGNSAAEVHKDIRDFFWPVTKNYRHKLMFFLIYCAFLLIPVTAQFLGQFRVGGAFIAFFMGLSMIMPWSRYFKYLKSIQNDWPSGEEQEALYRDFSEGTSVFGGEARIGRNYTFFKQELAIVPTKEIREFIPLRARSGVVIRAMLTDGHKQVTKIAYYKDMMPDLQKMLDEAAECLKR